MKSLSPSQALALQRTVRTIDASLNNKNLDSNAKLLAMVEANKRLGEYYAGLYKQNFPSGQICEYTTPVAGPDETLTQI